MCLFDVETTSDGCELARMLVVVAPGGCPHRAKSGRSPFEIQGKTQSLQARLPSVARVEMSVCSLFFFPPERLGWRKMREKAGLLFSTSGLNCVTLAAAVLSVCMTTQQANLHAHIHVIQWSKHGFHQQ